MVNDDLDDVFGNPRDGYCARCGGNGFFEQGGDWVNCGCNSPRDDVAVVSYLRVRHAVLGVSGSPEDGSLYGFETICGKRVGDPSEWIELPGTSPNCPDCRKIVTFPDQYEPEADGSETEYAIEGQYGLQQGDDWLIAHQLLIDTAAKYDGDVWMQGLGMINAVDAAFAMEAAGLLEDNGDEEYGGLRITAKGRKLVEHSPTNKRLKAEYDVIHERIAQERAEHAELVAEYREAGLVDDEGRYIGFGMPDDLTALDLSEDDGLLDHERAALERDRSRRYIQQADAEDAEEDRDYKSEYESENGLRETYEEHIGRVDAKLKAALPPTFKGLPDPLMWIEAAVDEVVAQRDVYKKALLALITQAQFIVDDGLGEFRDEGGMIVAKQPEDLQAAIESAQSVLDQYEPESQSPDASELNIPF